MKINRSKYSRSAHYRGLIRGAGLTEVGSITFGNKLIRQKAYKKHNIVLSLQPVVNGPASVSFLRAKAATELLSARLSHRNSVRLSHGWIRQKRSKLGSPNLHRRLPGRLVSGTVKLFRIFEGGHPE